MLARVLRAEVCGGHRAKPSKILLINSKKTTDKRFMLSHLSCVLIRYLSDRKQCAEVRFYPTSYRYASISFLVLLGFKAEVVKVLRTARQLARPPVSHPASLLVNVLVLLLISSSMFYGNTLMITKNEDCSCRTSIYYI